MKKIIFGVLLLFALASCDKEKRCMCTTSYLDGSVSTVNEYTITEGDCSDSNEVGTTFTTVCIEMK